MSLLQMSISGSVLILVIIVVRALLINRLAKKTFLALWGIVLLRLAVPFSIPSQFSFYTLIELAERKLLTPSLAPYSTLEIAPPPTAMLTGADKAETLVQSVLSISPLHVIWLAGVCACMVFFIAVYIKCKAEFRMSSAVQNEYVASWIKNHPLRRAIPVRQSNRIQAPLTYGVFHPVILLPTEIDWADHTKLQYILTHEYIHVRRFDSLTKLLLTGAVCVHWFNPFVWVMYVLANRDIELSCDETVVRTFGETMKSAYALTLIGLEEKKGAFSPLVSNFSKNAIEERIVSIMKIKKTSVVGIALAVLIVAGATTAFATSSAASNDAPTETGFTVSFTDDDGNQIYSDDKGASWLSSAQWDADQPAVEYWSYEDYKVWLDGEKKHLQNLVDTGAKYKKGQEWVTWTQNEVNAAISEYENVLAQIKSGLLVSKNFNGDENIEVQVNPITSDELSVSYEASVIGKDGNSVYLGDFDTAEARLEFIKQYCEEQVANGQMTKEEASQYIRNYQ